MPELDDARTWERMLASMSGFFRHVPERSGGHVLERPGVMAAITPAVPERSLPNSVVYADEDSLLAAYPEVEAAYADAGVAWTVWVPDHHARVRELLSAAGHELDARPVAMVADLIGVDGVEDDLDIDPAPRWEVVGALNDAAYGTGDSFTRMEGEGDADPACIHIARVDGRPAAVAGTRELNGDAGVWWVATHPDMRGRGLATALMRRALAAARSRGNDISTLQATQLGFPVYQRVGYRAFGTVEMWERRA